MRKGSASTEEAGAEEGGLGADSVAARGVVGGAAAGGVWDRVRAWGTHVLIVPDC